MSDFRFKSFTIDKSPGMGLAPDRETELRLRAALDRKEQLEKERKKGVKTISEKDSNPFDTDSNDNSTSGGQAQISISMPPYSTL